MFIDVLYLISIIASNCPEGITEVHNDYIIIDATICKDIIEKSCAAITYEISEIKLLPPIENKADSFSMYLYANLIKPSVHIVRVHVRQDFKSSKTPALITFHKDRL